MSEPSTWESSTIELSIGYASLYREQLAGPYIIHGPSM